jgi:putative DNA primase/helicase
LSSQTSEAGRAAGDRGGIEAKDTITVLFSTNPASKTIRQAPDGSIIIDDFQAGKEFGMRVVPLNDLEGLSALLMELERIPNALVIRGAPIAEPDSRGLYLRRKTHFLTPARGRHWVLIDFDKLPLPEGLDLRSAPRAVVEHLVQQLPEEFQDASYHYQLSSSAGFRAAGVASAHVWFWLKSARKDGELKR